MTAAATTTMPDDMTLHAATRQAIASHLHLVIDADGEVKLTPLLLPGMQKIAEADKQSPSVEQRRPR